MKTPTPANDNAPPGDDEIEFQAIRVEKLADRTVIGGTAAMIRMLSDFVVHSRSMEFVGRQLEDFGITDVGDGGPDELDAARMRVRKVLRRVLALANDNNPT